MKNLLLIGDKEFKKYFSKDFNVIVPNLNNNLFVADICKNEKIDVIFQIENLDKREIIYDIQEINCLKIFWAIDIHLNYYWQKDYFRNFHIIFSTQLNFIKIYKKENPHSQIVWLPWGIHDKHISKTFIPFKDRKYKISFVGLIDENRIKRRNIINLLKENFEVYLEGTSLKNRISPNRMFEIYRNSCVVINESILNDINFRYFEVTSQGAVLYTEKIKNGEDLLFKEKKEFLTYSQLNLVKKLKFYLKYPEITEKIAYNGYLKTKNFHKLSNRIKVVEEFINKYIYLKKKPIKSSSTSITLPLLKTFLRGIGKPEYKEKFKKLNKEKKLNILLLKLDDPKQFLKQAESYKQDPLILMNIITEKIDSFNINELTDFANKFLKDIPEYYQGYINVFKNSKLMLTVFEFIHYVYNFFFDKSVKHKKINHLSASILMKYNNYPAAIGYLLNLQREYPEKTLFRKMLAKCFYEIYEFDLWQREILKIFLLERKFNDFRRFKTDNEVKKEVIFEIITHIKDKKLIRDILFNFN